MKKATTTVAGYRFKRWNNKAYAVFNSLGKKVRIGVLLISYMTTVTAEGASIYDTTNQEPLYKDDDVVVLDEVVVSAQRSTAILADISRVVSVITKKEIEQAGVQSINELLEYVSSVDVRQRGQHGIQADITIRGGTFDQVLILLNGVNISDPQTGHHNFNLPVSLDAIERVEVVSGATSRIYGPNAFTGVVNLITGTYERNATIGKIVVGEYGLCNTNIFTTIQGNNNKQLLSLGYKKSDGYITNSDFKTLNAFYQGKWWNKCTYYDIQIGHTSNKFGANTFYSAKFPNQYENVQTTFASLKSVIQGKASRFQSIIYYRRKADVFELYRGMKNAASWYKGHNYHLTNVYGANLNYEISWKLGNTSVGGDFRSENILSNKLGNPCNPKPVCSKDNSFYNHKYSRHNVSLFMEHSMSFLDDRFYITAGVMANWNKDFKKGLEWYPGIDASFKVLNSLKVYGTANMAMRLPTFVDLFYNGPSNEGNTDLLPEKAKSYEIGFKYTTRFIRLHSAYFYRNSSNLIDWGKAKSDDTKWKTSNLNTINFSGYEFAMNLYPSYLYDGMWQNLLKIGIAYNYLHANHQQDKSYVSKYALDNLRHKFNTNATIILIDKLKLYLEASWQFREGSFQYYKTPKAKPVEKPYLPFWTINTNLTWESDRYSLFVGATNILNKTYYDVGNVIQPGRWVYGGVKFKLYWNKN